MKTCRFCAEEIKEEAVVCPHCTRDLNYLPYLPSNKKWEYCRLFHITHNANEFILEIKGGYFSLKAGEIWELEKFRKEEEAWKKLCSKSDFGIFFSDYVDHGDKKFKVKKDLHKHVMELVGALGEQGWEMCGFNSEVNNYFYIFKHQIY